MHFLQVCRSIHMCASFGKSVCQVFSTLFKSKLRARLFSVLRMARPDSLSCDTELLRYVLISFILENDLSALATVTGRPIVRNNLMAVSTVAYVSMFANNVSYVIYFIIKHFLYFLFFCSFNPFQCCLGSQ